MRSKLAAVAGTPFDFTTPTQVAARAHQVPGGYDHARYAVEQIYAPAADGVKVPRHTWLMEAVIEKLEREAKAPS